MFREVVKIGDKIDVRHILKSGSPYPNSRTYVSQLVDIIDNDIIHIATPISNSTPVILNVEEYFNLCFYTAKGLFQCNCVVLKNERENNIIKAIVRITSNLVKIQRRQYFRLECVMKTEYHVITNEELRLTNELTQSSKKNDQERVEIQNKLTEIESRWLPCIVVDISGGGVRFISGGVFEPGMIIKIKLNLEIGSGVNLIIPEANILSVQRVYNQTGVFEFRAEFIEISKKDREDIIKFIFEQERKRRGTTK